MNVWEFARRYADKPERRVIGLMSGTSVDGVDAARIRLSGSGRETRVTLERFVTYPFPPELRRQALAVSHGQGNAETVSRLNFALGALFAEAARAVAQDVPIDLIASHGQTVSHTAPTVAAAGGATLQIGEAALIAARLGVAVVSDFRVADMAVGGQGAPLIPYADWCLLTHPTHARAVQNIGGIGNVTFLPADAISKNVIGFDTGPGNMLIDRAAAFATGGTATYDKDGTIAARGSVCPPLLTWLREHPFLRQHPPKSAGREEFGERFWETARERAAAFPNCGPEDVTATMTAFTAESIADAYARFLPYPPDEVIVGGGGARNPVLMARLRERLAPARVRTHEEIGINGDAKEAMAFALLANEYMLGNPANLPSVTGASRPVRLGKITLP